MCIIKVKDFWYRFYVEENSFNWGNGMLFLNDNRKMYYVYVYSIMYYEKRKVKGIKILLKWKINYS